MIKYFKSINNLLLTHVDNISFFTPRLDVKPNHDLVTTSFNIFRMTLICQCSIAVSNLLEISGMIFDQNKNQKQTNLKVQN